MEANHFFHERKRYNISFLKENGTNPKNKANRRNIFRVPKITNNYDSYTNSYGF